MSRKAAAGRILKTAKSHPEATRKPPRGYLVDNR